jgi:hypothetical protein
MAHQIMDDRKTKSKSEACQLNADPYGQEDLSLLALDAKNGRRADPLRARSRAVFVSLFGRICR